MCLAGNVWNFFSNFVWNSRDYQDKIVTVKGKTDTNGYLFQNEKALVIHSWSDSECFKKAVSSGQSTNGLDGLPIHLKKMSIRLNGLPVCRTLVKYEPVYGLALRQFSVAQVDRESSRCLGGHRFESCGGLRFFLRPTLVTCWSFHFHKIRILLNGLPIRSKNVALQHPFELLRGPWTRLTETKSCHAAQQWHRNQNTIFFFDHKNFYNFD